MALSIEEKEKRKQERSAAKAAVAHAKTTAFSSLYEKLDKVKLSNGIGVGSRICLFLEFYSPCITLRIDDIDSPEQADAILKALRGVILFEREEKE